MITEDELLKVGYLVKPHGVKGEVSARIEQDVFENETPYLVCDIEGIYVPFFMESFRYKGAESALIKFEGVDSEPAAKRFSGKTLFFPRKYLPAEYSEPLTWDDYIGYIVEDVHQGVLGNLVSVDDSTLNLLLTVATPQGEILIPAADDFFVDTDDEERKIILTLPDGLLDLN